MFGLFKSSVDKQAEALEDASKHAADQYAFISKSIENTASELGIEYSRESYWNDPYVLGIFCGLVEINLQFFKLSNNGSSLAAGILRTLAKIKDDEFVKSDLTDELKIVAKAGKLYDERNESFLLALNRSSRFVAYSYGLRDYELEKDFIEVRALLLRNNDSYNEKLSPDWIASSDKVKVSSTYLSEKIIKPAFQSIESSNFIVADRAF